MSDCQPTVLALSAITKRFGRLLANDAISLSLKQGEVLALLGENGAGKSTLMSILFGHYQADEGNITVLGQHLPPGRPDLALAAGIGMVHQHFTLAGNLSVLDNIMVGTESFWRLASHRRAARQKLLALSEKFGLHVAPDALVKQISVGEKQRVEILKALYRGARILILDEPTAVLTPQEVNSLFATLTQMITDGMSVIFISHKLDEVMRISDRVAVLRQGQLIAECITQQTSKAALAELMVGRSVVMPQLEVIDQAKQASPVLTITGLTVVDADSKRANLSEFNLTVGKHEIVAIAGVAGNGQQALVSVLSGMAPYQSGSLTLGAQHPRAPTNPADWIAAKVGRIPEDRHQLGVVGDISVWENAIIEDIDHPRFSRLGLLNAQAAKQYAKHIIRRFDVRAVSADVPVRSLSGGNMQKLILGRTLVRKPQLIIADQPTWGLDIGAVAYIRKQLLMARARGAGIILVSEDLDEIFALADRIAVLCNGRLIADRPVSEWDANRVGLAMTGVTPEPIHI